MKRYFLSLDLDGGSIKAATQLIGFLLDKVPADVLTDALPALVKECKPHGLLIIDDDAYYSLGEPQMGDVLPGYTLSGVQPVTWCGYSQKWV